MSKKKKNEMIEEYCSFCGDEVLIRNDFKHKQTCPTCGAPIRPCSQCDWNVVDCRKCPLGNPNENAVVVSAVTIVPKALEEETPTEKVVVRVSREITQSNISDAERVLADNGIDKDEVDTVLQAIGYTLLDTELYPED